jgi:hypothetical protein
MSIHKFSVLTSDLDRDPSILDRIHNHVAPEAAVTVTEDGPVTTVTAVMA